MRYKKRNITSERRHHRIDVVLYSYTNYYVIFSKNYIKELLRKQDKFNKNT